jgi:hypothetical protein
MRINFLILFTFSLFYWQFATSQPLPDDSKRDYYYKIGCGPAFGYPGGSYLNFNQGPFTKGAAYLEYNLGIESAGICDIYGNLLFNCNGTHVLDSTGHVMPHGDSINFGQVYSSYYQGVGYPIFQGVIILPKPMTTYLYYIFHIMLAIPQPVALGLSYSLVDMSLNNGLGDVVLKNQVVITDTIQYGFLTACRHGNGRDWWIILSEVGELSFNRILIDPEGIHVLDKQYVGDPVSGGNQRSGYASFSPDGTLYAQGYQIPYGPFAVDLFSFDRCSGFLYDYKGFTFTTPDYLDYFFDIEFSPNSKLLYAMLDRNVYQFDVTSSNIAGSKQLIANLDGFIWMQSLTGFTQSQLTPDNRIFIAAGGTPYIHIINYPDSSGTSCALTQHSLLLNSQIYSTPNYPNFRLGRWVGSPCDVLIGKENPEYELAKLSCFPNPVADNISFELEMMNKNFQMKLEIYNLLSDKLGEVFTSPFQSIIHYNASSLTNGIYVAVLKKEGKILTSCRFVVNK